MPSTQKIYKIEAIGFTHINPSILEGGIFTPSIIGPKVAIPIIKYAPTYITAPSISGNFRIPDVLVCNPGVIEASPQASYTYQWRSDSVDIVGATSSIFTTYQSLNASVITCYVTATNTEGSVTGESNGITVEVIEPIINQQNDVVVVTGLAQEGLQGIGDVYGIVLAGTAAPNRIDSVSSYGFSITGLNSPPKTDILGYDIYAIWVPTLIGDVAIINPDAETGDMTGWIIDVGNIASVTTAPTVSTQGRQGTYFFKGDDLGPTIQSTMHQVVTLNPNIYTIIDANHVHGILSFIHDSQFGYDSVSVTVDYLDISDVILQTINVSPLPQPQNLPWSSETSEMVRLPNLTRKVRISVSFSVGSNFQSNTNAYLDQLRIQLYNEL